MDIRDIVIGFPKIQVYAKRLQLSNKRVCMVHYYLSLSIGSWPHVSPSINEKEYCCKSGTKWKQVKSNETSHTFSFRHGPSPAEPACCSIAVGRHIPEPGASQNSPVASPYLEPPATRCGQIVVCAVPLLPPYIRWRPSTQLSGSNDDSNQKGHLSLLLKDKLSEPQPVIVGVSFSTLISIRDRPTNRSLFSSSSSQSNLYSLASQVCLPGYLSVPFLPLNSVLLRPAISWITSLISPSNRLPLSNTRYNYSTVT